MEGIIILSAVDLATNQPEEKDTIARWWCPVAYHSHRYVSNLLKWKTKSANECDNASWPDILKTDTKNCLNTNKEGIQEQYVTPSNTFHFKRISPNRKLPSPSAFNVSTVTY